MTSLSTTNSQPYCQLLNLVDERKEQLAILNHPTLKRLSHKYPEADFNQWYNGATFALYLDGDGNNPLYDISNHPNVQAGTEGYELEVKLYQKELKPKNRRPFKATVTIYVSQPYTPEETELLTSIGKLKQIRETKTYTALTCGE